MKQRTKQRLAACGLGLGAFLSLAPGSEAAPGIVPDDFPSIQIALDQARPGDRIQVRDTGSPWFETLEFPRSGDETSGFISLEAFPGDRPILDATGVTGGDVVLIRDKSWVRLQGFVIRNLRNVNDGSGVRILGGGAQIEILDNEIHDIRGDHAMGLTVYGTDRSTSISDLVIRGNLIHDCEPARSEALVLNGNVERFLVEDNEVRDVNNIGIDFIGGETDIQPDPTLVARNGSCRGNLVVRANSIYGGGYAGGIYVDGGRDILIERNVVTGCDLGIEIGAENAGTDTTGIVVRDNFIYRNEKVGLIFGGYARNVGRVRGCSFLNNTTWGNDTLGEGVGELWIQFAENNLLRNNVFVAEGQPVLTYSEDGNVNNELDYNLWFRAGAGAAEFVWQGVFYPDFASWSAASGQGAFSSFEDPLLVDAAAGDPHLITGSPAIDTGDPAFVPGDDESDLDGEQRLQGDAVDRGADEVAQACDATALEAVSDLRVEREGVGMRFSWAAADAPEIHVNALTTLSASRAPRFHRPRLPGAEAEATCDASPPASDCLAAGNGEALVFYLVLAACGPDGALEGPLD